MRRASSPSAIGLGGVGATWWLGRRAYGTGAAIVGAAAVAVATTHVAYSRMAVTDVLLTLAITCVLALAVEGRIEWAGLAVGLAASAKYPGAIAPCPCSWPGGEGGARSAGPARLAVAGFALTSPFVLIHARRAWDDISRVQRLARGGLARVRGRPGRRRSPTSTGSGTPSARSCSSRASALVAALVRRTRTDLVLLSFAVAYWLTLMPQQAHFERYVLPARPGAGRPRGERPRGRSRSRSSRSCFRSPGASPTPVS